jgi:hypothetical protein
LRNGQKRQAFATDKSLALDVRNTPADRNPVEASAIGECSIRRWGTADPGTAFARKSSNARDAVPNDNVGQTAASRESTSEADNIIRNYYLSQRAAPRKRIITDARDTIAHEDICEPGAIAKRRSFQTGNAVRNADSDEAIAVGKGCSPNAGYPFAQGDIG